RFRFEEVTLGDFQVIIKKDNTPVLIIENMYEVLCKTHSEVDQHEIVEKFVNNCTICAVRKPSFYPLAAKPIIAKNFLSQMQ
ncbi:10474_t:CDS:2, partial [Cetraspora pellucida]